MTTAPFVSLSSFLLEDNDLLVPFVLQNFGCNRCTLNGGRTEGGFTFVNEHEHLLNLDLIPSLVMLESD